MIYKIKEESWKKYNNKRGGGDDNFSETWVDHYQGFYRSTNDLKISDFIIDEENAMIEIVYNRLTAKTSRYKFREKMKDISEIPQRDTKIIVQNNKLYLSVIYQISINELQEFINNINIVRSEIGEELTELKYNEINKPTKKIFKTLKNILIIKKPFTPQVTNTIAYVQFYKIGDINKIQLLLAENGVNLSQENVVDEERLIFLLSGDFIKIINQKIPWLISEIIDGSPFFVDLNDSDWLEQELNINTTGEEPLVGVIDSGFNHNSPLNNFVESNHDFRENKKYRDTTHGTAVSSIIIANDQINTNDQDGLGNFRVRHFEILEPSNEKGDAQVNWAYFYQKLEEIIVNNIDIKVWNLSIGGQRNDAFGISSHGILLDKLSNEYDCIFSIASGNAGNIQIDRNHTLCSPGDSLNNLTVGSVNREGTKIQRSDYSSLGFVLQNIKPDISEFGGPHLESGSNNFVHDGIGFTESQGTSFSTPKVSRYLAYYVNKGYSTQEAKAKLISLTTKEKPRHASSRYGYISKDNNGFEVSQTIKIDKKQKIVSKLNIPLGVEKIIVTTSYSVKPIPILGHEASIYDIKACLFEFSEEHDSTKTGESRVYASGKEVNSATSEIKYTKLFEEEQRFKLGKYSTSKKIIYNWAKQKNNTTKEFVGIKLQRLDLHDVENSEIIDVSINIKFIGEHINEDTFAQFNDVEIVNEIEQDIIIERF